ncbi:alpha-L-arabinofuranosidase C-terminal domain-containing protein [uncultured Draconibacterium sp.]|uniref:alpha-L-arabinofuranosidase C-terminal domain-containing protein n=1 Tax=uncultured Draconibacterium sp. TaxID=1573823 RepID=UPI0029C718CB|nr:alpha-L-arabinofuranosidase C-terminal domain-containing protein [uncultured Draconibacterium sp.]
MVHLNRIILAVTLTLFTVVSLKAQVPKGGKEISTNLFGLFFEDINYAADGGLYAELVQNRSFEYNPTEQSDWNPFSFWEYISPGFSYGRISVETKAPVHANNPHYMVLEVEHVGHEAKFSGISGVGIKNSGFDGIVVRNGEQYNFSMFAQQLSENPMELLVSLEDAKGEVLASKTIKTNSGDWKKYTAVLNAEASCDSAFLVVLARSNGALAMDMISLFPDKTFKNRANGMRADLAQVLADMKPKFVRFPGGCLVHGDGLGNMYRWKNTIGPLEQRIEQRNIWGYHQSAGLGYFEYFQFCEDIGAKPVPIVPAAVSCQNSGGTWRIGGTGQKALPENEMDEYIQEVLDLIEWANGSVTSVWGGKRAAAGHPEPFNLEYVGIGNEDKITPEFEERFNLIYKAVKEKYPEINVIGTVGPFLEGEDFEKGWEIADQLKLEMVDEHYYTQPEWFLGNQQRYDSYKRNATKVYLGEYASWGNKMWNAIAEAAYMTALERNGDVVAMASYAPLLAKQNFTQWTTDMIFFNNTNICLTPNYHVQKMFMSNQGDFYFDNVVEVAQNDTTLAASCVYDSQSGDIILKMVNAGNSAKTMKINLARFKNMIPKAKLTLLKADPEAENALENPESVVPELSDFTVQKKFDYKVPTMSFSLIRIKAN